MGATSQTVNEWIARAKEGDADAFSEIVRHHQQGVYAFILGWVRNPTTADELTQDTFVRAWKAISTFRGDCAFQSWLFQIALNAVRSWGRWSILRRAREGVLPEPVDTRSDADPSRLMISGEIGRKITVAIDRLPPKEKNVFMLRHFSDLALKDIADVLGVAEGSVKAHLFHATVKMRKCLQETL